MRIAPPASDFWRRTCRTEPSAASFLHSAAVLRRGMRTVYPVCVPHSVAAAHHSWMYRRGVLPILALLRMGATPRRLAWSIAAGLLIGINPVVGTTTVLCLAVAFVFRLNVVA